MCRIRSITLLVIVAVLLGSMKGQEPGAVFIAARPRGFRALMEELEGLRLFPLRLSVARDWSVCSAPSGSGLKEGCASGILIASHSRRFREIGQQIRSEARERPTGQTLHALGLWYLVDASNVDKLELAVASLREAAAELPLSAETWNDLAVAYYVLAYKRGSLEDLIRSMASCDRALQDDPQLRGALFNRAVIFNDLQLHGDAARAWQRFLRSGDSPGWLGEAQSRLAHSVLPQHSNGLRFSEWLTSRFHQLSVAEVDELVANDPVGAVRFVELNLLGDVSAPYAWEKVRLARLIAETLHMRTGDCLVTEEVEVWAQAIRAGGESMRGIIAGYSAFQRGSILYKRLDAARALGQFERAARDLQRSGSPLYLWAKYWVAVCTYWAGDLKGAATKLTIVQNIASRESSLLHGYIELMLGLISASESDFDRALERYSGARATFQRANAAEETGFTQTLVAQVMEKVNDPHAAWQNLRSALLTSKDWRNQRWREGLFAEAADVVRSMGDPETALYFQSVALKAALLSGQPATVSEEYSFRSMALTHLGRLVPATADAREARRWLGKIADKSIRQQSEDSVLVAEARLNVRERPGEAANALTSAIRDRRRRKATALLAELELEQGRLLESLGRADEAEKSFLAAVSAVETGSASLSAEARRSGYFSTAREAFDNIIRFEADVRRNPKAALVFTDRARIHEFLASRVNRGGHPTLRGLATLQSRLGKQDGVLVYRTLKDKLLIWLVKQDGVYFFESDLSTRDLTELVGNLTRSLQSSLDETSLAQATITRWSDKLFRELIKPVAGLLNDMEHLWIVPDGPLFQLPFGVLTNPVSGRFLFEGRRLAKALTAGLGEPHRDAGEHELAGLKSVLAVGDPEFSSVSFGHLPRLPHAREEASLVADAYPEALVLVGRDATRDRFLAEAGREEVVHFAGHALLNREEPELSTLVFAPDAEKRDSGAIYAKDIESLTLKHTRLVVLSSCSTLGGEGAASGGFYGLARPFLAAGAQVIVGSLWEVDDASTSQFFATFHRLLREIGDPFRALQRSQKADLDRGKSAGSSVYKWAAFEAYVVRPEPN